MTQDESPRTRSPGGFLKYHLVTRLMDVDVDPAMHKRKVIRGLASTTIYAVAYGVYEYFIVYKGLMWNVLNEQSNWAIMIGGLFVVILASTGANVELLVVSLLHLFLLEDLSYWFCQWLETGVYPFPTLNWFDGFFASFRVLGGIGQAIDIWPHVPFFYIPGFGAVIVYYIASWKSAKAGRFAAWIIGPFFIAIIAGTMVSEEIAALFLIIIPIVFYSHALLALAVKVHDAR